MSVRPVATSSPIARTVVGLALLAPVLLGCGEGGGGAKTTPGTRITVAAAASTTEALDEIAEAFEEADHGSIEVSLDSSAILARQIAEGAPVDVFLSADAVPMNELVDADLVMGEPVVVARNRIVVITPAGDPAGIRNLAGLARADLVALCEPSAPCGRAAEQLLDAEDVEIDEGSISRGRNARETLRAVVDGGLDAGIVFATDARIAGDRVEIVEIPKNADPVDLLAVRIDHGGPHDRPGEPTDRERTAEAFLAFLRGPEARRILADHGFLPADRGEPT